MRSRQLETALGELFTASAARLHADVAAGAEVPFELGAQSSRRGAGATLYCYRALTGEFIGEREAELKRLPGYAEASKLLEDFDGLDRYLASVGGEAARAKGRARPRAAIKALLEDVFDEQSDFELAPERTRAALERLAQSTLASASEVTLVATLHGVTLASTELQLTKGLRIARADDLPRLPDGIASALAADAEEAALIVIYTTDQDDPADALATGRAVFEDLLSALRLFGDGRVTLGALAWARVGVGAWGPLALGAGGRPHGMLVVTAEQEDELRAFCNLVSRRAPHDNDLAWALRRFELACERDSPWEALTDNLLALRALLEPEGAGSGRLAGRLAALCATPEQRTELTERATRAVALERSLIAGTAAKDAAGRSLVEDIANHLRSLLRDVICGHLDPDLAVIADELLEPDELLHADEASDLEPDNRPNDALAGEPSDSQLPMQPALDAELRSDTELDAELAADDYRELDLAHDADVAYDAELELVDAVDADGEIAGVDEQPLPIDGVVSSLS
ncbi:MAG TPA: hypothetical protein VK761_04525 [Solirubrobacteraceae bacterium]|nr:hypothetical protein [Solirubrobacteraceae bacterium]